MRYLLVLLVAGCTSLVPIDTSIAPPADWPTLKETISHIEPSQLASICNVPAAIAARSVSCAVIDFSRARCSIFLATTDPAALEHERLHCRGYDHVGDANKSRDAWERYKASAGK